MSGLDNIIQIIDVILAHIKDYKSIKDVLEESKTRAQRTSRNISEINCLPDVDRVLPNFFHETVEEFRSICENFVISKKNLLIVQLQDLCCLRHLLVRS